MKAYKRWFPFGGEKKKFYEVLGFQPLPLEVGITETILSSYSVVIWSQIPVSCDQSHL